MRKYFTLLILAIAGSIQGQDHNFEWVKQIGLDGVDVGYDLALDDDDNVFLSGRIENLVDLDPGPEEHIGGIAQDHSVFISKFDDDGDFLWSIDFPISIEFPYFEPWKFETDHEGNLYVTGNFGKPLDIDPSGDMELLSPNGLSNFFVAKFNAEGKLQWAKTFASNDDEQVYAIKVDARSNVLLTGKFKGSIDFDPGEELYLLQTETTSTDIFILSLNGEGDFNWASALGGDFSDRGTHLIIDEFDNIILAGVFEGISDLDPGPTIKLFESAGGFDCFVVKINRDGTLRWAKQFGGENNDIIAGLVNDNEQNILLTGYYSEESMFDVTNKNISLVSAGGLDIFVLKLEQDGTYQWVKSMGGSKSDKPESIAVDENGNVYTVGFFSEKADFNPSPFQDYFLEFNSSSHLFVSKLSENGTFRWAKGMGGVWSQKASSIVFDKNDDLYLTGNFGGNMDFDFGGDEYFIEALSSSDLFFLKLKKDSFNPINNIPSNVFNIYPNPNDGAFSIEVPKNLKEVNLQIIDALGRICRSEKNIQKQYIEINQKLESGLYFVKLFDENQETISTKKLFIK